MFKTKKAGCGTYADISDNYMLYDKAVVPTTGGKKSKSKAKKSKAKKAMGVKKTKKTKGGVFMDNMASATSNLLSSMQQTLPSTTTPPPPPPAVSKGGSRRGGMFPTNLTDTMNNLLQSKGGSKAKGGSLELAPFAAALAFLATRFATDKSFKLKDIFGRKKSSKTTKSAVKSKSKSLA
jgi:hypothetical protein